ncbi:Cyclin-dependent kinase inhibitor 3 [Frankliniella fusca]|uniref:protein-tyrosine-phosphatase n=1 Tax=Frankliniella fusca TaxID=407009 RepID=A0AAE1I078_9NEOP|nr:Cyclin-dependent kinase inhibitor 3 [Frankliniella fusca]
MSDSNQSTLHPFPIVWFNCSQVVELDSVAVGVMPGMKFKSTWRNVDQDIKVLSDNGISNVFCLCKQSELSFFRVRELFDAYRDKGIKVHHYPIEPDLSPDYKEIYKICLDLWDTLLEGSKVFIHAQSTLGRVSVLMAAFYMELEEDVTPAHAIFKIRELIGRGAFQTMQQYNFIDGFRDYQTEHRNRTLSEDV